MVWIILLLLAVALACGGIKFIKWLTRPSYIYRWENDIYVSDKELTAGQQLKAREKLENKRKRKN